MNNVLEENTITNVEKKEDVLDITNQLKEAIDFNKHRSQINEWNAEAYRQKYGI